MEKSKDRIAEPGGVQANQGGSMKSRQRAVGEKDKRDRHEPAVGLESHKYQRTPPLARSPAVKTGGEYGGKILCEEMKTEERGRTPSASLHTPRLPHASPCAPSSPSPSYLPPHGPITLAPRGAASSPKLGKAFSAQSAPSVVAGAETLNTLSSDAGPGTQGLSSVTGILKVPSSSAEAGAQGLTAGMERNSTGKCTPGLVSNTGSQKNLSGNARTAAEPAATARVAEAAVPFLRPRSSHPPPAPQSESPAVEAPRKSTLPSSLEGTAGGESVGSHSQVPTAEAPLDSPLQPTLPSILEGSEGGERVESHSQVPRLAEIAAELVSDSERDMAAKMEAYRGMADAQWAEKEAHVRGKVEEYKSEVEDVEKFFKRQVLKKLREVVASIRGDL